MSQFIKKGNKYFRNNSDGSQSEVQLGEDGYFRWTQNDGKKVRSAKKYKVVTKPKEKSFIQKVGDWLVDASIGASVAENPSVMTAAGYEKENGKWQVNPTSKGATKLREDLPVIGMTGLAVSTPGAGAVTGASINDIKLNGPTTGNIIGTTLGLGGLAFEAAPTVYTTIRNAVRPTIIGTKMSNTPLQEVTTPVLTPKIQYISNISTVPKTRNINWNKATIALHNRPFIEAYNKWNRFGYPGIPKKLIYDTPKLEAFVKGQLNRHNTFSRGVQVLQSEKQALEQQLGKSLTNDEFLKIVATTPRSNGEGQAGLWITPYSEIAEIYGNGEIALVRRPFKLGSDRMKWFDEASFDVQYNPLGKNEYTDIMAPWRSKPVLNWRGIPEGTISIAPESELLSPVPMELINFTKGNKHMNYKISLNSNPFYTKGNNYFDPNSGQWVIESYKKGGRLIPKADSGMKVKYISSNSEEAKLNKRRQQILQKAGNNIKVDGSWGNWQQNLWNKYISSHPDQTKKVNFNNVTVKENRNRTIPVDAMEQFQDSLTGRYYPYAQRLAILASSLQEVDERGAATEGVGGNGYLGLNTNRMSSEYLDDSVEGRAKQIKYILDDLETIKGFPNNNWTSGDNQSPYVKSAQEGFDLFWNANTPRDATIYLNKNYIRPKGKAESRNNRAVISEILMNK